GCVLGEWDLKRAITLGQRLYSVDAVSLGVESDLEDDLEGGRRALLTALASTDADRKSSAIDEARAAATRVQDALRHLRSLDPPDVLRLIDQFERSWYDYTRVADEVLHHSRLGNPAAAIQLESANGQLSFGSTLLNLRTLKQGLEEHSKVDSTQVDEMLKYSAWGFAEFGVSVLIILIALGKANQDRRKALLE